MSNAPEHSTAWDSDPYGLRTDWAELLQGLGPGRALADRIFVDLAQAYLAEGRFYHNLRHVRQVLDTLRSLRDQANNFAALELAAWFHDVVYDTRASDNEERSAAFAQETLQGLRLPQNLIDQVSRHILDTWMHTPLVPDADSHIFLDADLAILGSSEAEYRRYADAIRREHAWVPDEQYRLGREQVLRRFLQRPRIYLTERMFAALEAQARRNLAQEIASLK
jgi:predicted metal-dependent HD superfamily phosphohydrolase